MDIDAESAAVSVIDPRETVFLAYSLSPSFLVGFRLVHLADFSSVFLMFSNKISLLIAVLMFAASAGAVALRPDVKMSAISPISLETIVPRQFGNWREEPQRSVQVVNPQTQELLDKLYSQILARIYVNNDGYRIMLSLAYGSDLKGALQAHKPEVCYPAQGFKLHSNEPGNLVTQFGTIPVRRLFTSLGFREEPVTYWFTIGDDAVQGRLQKRLVGLTYTLTGRIPDGLLFRVSSIDGNRSRAFAIHDEFVKELLETVSSEDRKRLSGLGISAG